MRGTLPKKPGPEDNAMYSDTTLAINPDTGKLEWYHQHLEDDTWDLDYVYERLLIGSSVFTTDPAGRRVTTGSSTISQALDNVVEIPRCRLRGVDGTTQACRYPD